MHALYGENVLKYYFIIIILFILSVFFFIHCNIFLIFVAYLRTEW